LQNIQNQRYVSTEGKHVVVDGRVSSSYQAIPENTRTVQHLKDERKIKTFYRG
jgi:hypothetical protein